MELNKIRKRVFSGIIIGWLFVAIGTLLLRINIFFSFLIFIGFGFMVHSSFLAFSYGIKIEQKIMDGKKDR